MKLVFLILSIMIFFLLYKQSSSILKQEEIPNFLQTDTIVQNHTTQIKTIIKSGKYKPYDGEIKKLEQDYSAIWAHLNNLYSTNNAAKGKLYYTQNWFKQICSGDFNFYTTGIERKDSTHNLHIMNWENDGLLCTIIDSNIQLQYKYANNNILYTNCTVAFILLYQGENWCVDAIRVLDERPIKKD